MNTLDRRTWLRFAGATLGAGALYHVAPAKGALALLAGRKNGEKVTPFSFVQLSDTHVGFSGPPNPLGTQAFERAIEEINGLAVRPDLVLFTGDLTHDSEKPGEHAERMRLFQTLVKRLKVPRVHYVPGEHDAGLDGGTLFREHFGETSSSFDHRGVHFVGLDNVSRGKPEVGAERIAWLKKDLARFPTTAPIVLFTHRPLFDLEPEWEWFTSDGDEVMKAVEPYENVTVLYGHIHRRHVRESGKVRHYAARSLIFGFPDPATGVPKKPLGFDPKAPFHELGFRRADVAAGAALGVDDVELTTREFSGTVGMQQITKEAFSS